MDIDIRRQLVEEKSAAHGLQSLVLHCSFSGALTHLWSMPVPPAHERQTSIAAHEAHRRSVGHSVWHFFINVTSFLLELRIFQGCFHLTF